MEEESQSPQLAQAAGRVFDVRFQMIDRPLKLQVPLFRHARNIFAQLRARIANLPEQRLVASQKAPVEQAHR